ncbi:MAG: glycosyltransferase family 1 protein [Candidatus Micrarchaeota archaeon]
MLDVDLITATRMAEQGQLYGILRSVSETSKRLPKYGISTHEIAFSQKSRSATYYLTLYLSYPFQIAREKRSPIAHLTSETIAALLNTPIFDGQKTLLTVHEVHPFLNQRELPVPKRLIAKMNIAGMRRAFHIIAVSEFLKRELVVEFGIPSNRISVVHNAVDHRIFRKMKVPSGFLKKHHIPGNSPIILYVGSEEPRKNLSVLISALGKLRQSGIKFTFVKAGKPSWPGGRENTRHWLKKAGIYGQTVFLDYVEEADLPLLYNSASVFVYPCYYAGFGLPPLEAMACGVPVVASKSAAIPEVVGDAGILVNPSKPGEFANAIRKLLSSAFLRKKYSGLAQKQSRKFNWDDSARKLASVYRKIAGE